MTSATPAPLSLSSLIRRELLTLFSPSQSQYLRTIKNGQPIWTEDPSQAQAFFTEQAAMKIRQLLDVPTIPRSIAYVRSAHDPLSWRVSDE